jgi:hypothetical protein
MNDGFFRGFVTAPWMAGLTTICGSEYRRLVRRVSIVFAIFVFAALGGTASAGPTAPGPMVGVPAFMPGPLGVLTFDPSVPQGNPPFDPPGAIAYYGYYYTDHTTGFSSLGSIKQEPVPIPAPPNVLFGAPDGHDISIRVEAFEIVRPGVITGSYTTNETVRFRIDSTPPTGSFEVVTGRYSPTRDLTLQLSADDPAPAPGLPPSGVATFRVGEPDFVCETLILSPNRPSPRREGCPRPMAATAPYTLAAGLDGKRAIELQFRDRSDIQRPRVSALQQSTLVVGNGSPLLTREVFLDRLAPSPVVSFSAGVAVAGTPITLSGSDSADGSNNPMRDSGLDPAGFQWQFGDGQTASGRRVAHAFANPGTYRGRLTVRDLAGNSASTTMQVDVAAASSAGSGSGGAPSTAEGAKTGGAAAPGRLRLSHLRITGPRRAGSRSIVRVDVTGAAALRGRVLRYANDGRSVVVARFRGRTLRPGASRMRVRWPAAGRYAVLVTAGAVTVRGRVRIARARPR